MGLFFARPAPCTTSRRYRHWIISALGEICVFSLEKRRLRGSQQLSSTTSTEILKITEPGFPSMHSRKAGGNGLRLKQRKLQTNVRKIHPLWGQWNTSLGCPEGCRISILRNSKLRQWCQTVWCNFELSSASSRELDKMISKRLFQP